MRLAEGTVIADRFRLVRALGRGGMGEVWLAHHIGLDTSCAVKFIHAHVAAAKETRARFEREARVVAQLKSPHVVQVIDYGECEGMPYIAMEYLEGEDLGRRLHRLGRLAPMDTWLLLSQMARALGKAHAAGLVHRDLKPENVFLIRDDEHETVKILDFGIAKSSSVAISHGSTATGVLLGTPSYMSPEQAQGIKSVDWRSDLWSMAVVAYRCLTGQLPFNSEALGDLLVKIIVQPLPIPSRAAPDLPAGIDAWWARAAARDPAHRFQSAKEMVEALGSALEISSAYGRPSALYSQPYSGQPATTPSGDARYSGGQWTPQGASGGVAPTTGDPVAQLSFGNGEQLRDPPVNPTVPGISHTMANERARRARVGVVIGSVLTVGAVAAAIAVAVSFGRGGDETSPSPAPASSMIPAVTETAAPAASTAAPEVVPGATAEPTAPSATPVAGPMVKPVATPPTSKPSAPAAPAHTTTPAAPAKTTAPAAPAKTGSKPFNPGF